MAEKQHHVGTAPAFMNQHGLVPAAPVRRNASLPRPRLMPGSAVHGVRSAARSRWPPPISSARCTCGHSKRRPVAANLRALCRMLVADQLAHVGFESGSATGFACSAHRSAFGAQCGRLPCARTSRVHRVNAWIAHRPVLEAAGYSVSTFIRACSAQWTFYLEPPGRSRLLRRPDRATVPIPAVTGPEMPPNPRRLNLRSCWPRTSAQRERAQATRPVSAGERRHSPAHNVVRPSGFGPVRFT